MRTPASSAVVKLKRAPRVVGTARSKYSAPPVIPSAGENRPDGFHRLVSPTGLMPNAMVCASSAGGSRQSLPEGQGAPVPCLLRNGAEVPATGIRSKVYSVVRDRPTVVPIDRA